MLVRHNIHLDKRLSGMLNTLNAAYEAGVPLSSASKGSEREWFVNNLLTLVFPNQFRFSSGEITDRYTAISGQVDVVVEYPHRYSLASYQDGPRLFMAESVAAAIEVKSNVCDQWTQVCETAEKIKHIRRTFAYQYWENILQELESGVAEGGKGEVETDPELLQKYKINAKKQMEIAKNQGSESIPVYAVGFDGWEKPETLQEKVKGSNIDGIFQIKKPMFTTGGYIHKGPSSLFQFLNVLEGRMNDVVSLEPSFMGYTVSS